MRKFSFLLLFCLSAYQSALSAHCQMPCGIYHDDMVYDMIDQYVETMHKAITELNTIKLDTAFDKNQYIRWIIQKDKQSDDAASLITTYFLQQKIKPGDEDTPKKLASAHKLLFMMVAIKQNCDVKLVHQFMEEWDKFKLMFHREGYECKIEQIKLKKWKEESDRLKKQEAMENSKKPEKKPIASEK